MVLLSSPPSLPHPHFAVTFPARSVESLDPKGYGVSVTSGTIQHLPVDRANFLFDPPPLEFEFVVGDQMADNIKLFVMRFVGQSGGE